MKIILELFGASRDFSKKDYLEFEIKDQISIKDFKEKLLTFIDEKFKGNNDFKKIIQSSAFCSEKNEIISDNYKILKEQKIGIIPPIGGG
jgi:molybdopterin synthase sulfur carrier subunit|tara:strand:- start:173 stop:442 length:270 start_codon:yes stop_codon:yes gene_type:complete